MAPVAATAGYAWRAAGAVTWLPQLCFASRRSPLVIPGHPGDGVGGRLRAGQGGRPAQPDAHRRHPRHAALHAAGSLRGKDRCPRRRRWHSLGLTLYELLAFRPAFDEKERNRLIKRVTQQEPPPIGQVDQVASSRPRTIVSKEYIDRYPRGGGIRRPRSWQPTCNGSSMTSRSGPGGRVFRSVRGAGASGTQWLRA